MKNPKIFIVTLVYRKSLKLIKEYLDNISSIDHDNYQIILIYNNNDPKYFKKLKILCQNYLKIILINNKKNYGFTKAANVGIKYSLKNGGDYTLLLNDDVKVEKDLIKELILPFKNKKMGMASPIILDDSKKRKIWYAGGMISEYFAYTRNFYMGLRFSQKIKSGWTNVISGCCVMVRNKLWQKVGLLDEDLFIYFDDPDLSLRARKKGYFCYLVAKPLVIHLKKSAKLNSTESYYYARNPFILIRKHYPGFKKITAYFGQFAIWLPRNLIRLKGGESLNNYLKGIRDGISGVVG